MHFKIGNTYTSIEDEGNNLSTVEQLCEIKYKYYGMDWSTHPPRQKFKMAVLSYLNKNLEFPTGWLPEILTVLKNRGIPITWEDARVAPPLDPNFFDLSLLFPPRDYQQEALDIAEIIPRGIFKHATGAGKSLLMAWLVGKMGLNTLIIVPSKTLLFQLYDNNGRIRDRKGNLTCSLASFFGYEHLGLVGAGHFDLNKVTVATAQTLWSRFKNKDPELMEYLKTVDALFVDEAHHINVRGKDDLRNSYYIIANHTPAYYRYGFTATPGDEKSLDYKILQSVTGKIIHEVSSTLLIEKGYLTRPEIFIYRIPGMKKYGNWRTAYKKEILENTYRNKAVATLARNWAKEGKRVLITVRRVKQHGKILKDLIPEAEFMYGQTSDDDRKRILKDFEDGKTKIVISTIIKEGVNIPAMDCLIRAGAGKSHTETVQKIGRVLRKSEGKNIAKVVDFYDEDKGMLTRHSRERIKAYKEEEGFIVHPKEEIPIDGF